MLDRTRIDPIPSNPDSAAPSHDEVSAALDRIVHSTEFRASPHLAAFLTFSVEKSLAGEATFIKAYSIATSVLGRHPSFDPQADPIVRVEATRLRRALERYYLHDGADDPILIDIPRGRYIAYFSYRDQGRRPEAPEVSSSDILPPDTDVLFANEAPNSNNPMPSSRSYLQSVWANLGQSERRSVTVFALALMGAFMTWSFVPMRSDVQKPLEQALILQPITTASIQNNAHAIDTVSPPNTEGISNRILFAMLQLVPFSNTSNHPEADEIAHRLITKLASLAPEFEGIPVFDPDMPTASTGNDLQLYTLMGTVFERMGEKRLVDISIRLVHQTSREIVWTRDFAINLDDSAGDAPIQRVADNVLVSLAGINGAIRVDDARRHHDSDQASSICQLCLANSDVALRTGKSDQINEAIACLSNLLTKKPDESLIYKQLAALRLAAGGDPDMRAKNLTLAASDLEAAIRLAPDDQFARRALLRLQSAQAQGL